MPPTPGQGSVAIASAPAVVASTLSPPPAPSEDGGPLLGSVSPIVRHHEDSGLRLGARVVDVPPAYTRA